MAPDHTQSEGRRGARHRVRRRVCRCCMHRLRGRIRDITVVSTRPLLDRRLGNGYVRPPVRRHLWVGSMILTSCACENMLDIRPTLFP
jgi:hypothetical protein